MELNALGVPDTSATSEAPTTATTTMDVSRHAACGVLLAGGSGGEIRGGDATGRLPTLRTAMASLLAGLSLMLEGRSLVSSRMTTPHTRPHITLPLHARRCMIIPDEAGSGRDQSSQGRVGSRSDFTDTCVDASFAAAAGSCICSIGQQTN